MARAALVWVLRPGGILRLICLKIYPHPGKYTCARLQVAIGYQRKFHGETGMDEEIKKGFQQAIDQRHQRDVKARQTAERAADEKKALQFEWNTKRDQIVAPALREIEQILQPGGWVTNIIVGSTKGEISFFVYRGNITTTNGSRPAIVFSVAIEQKEVTTHVMSVSMSGPGPTINLSTISKDDVQKAALDFFKRLSDERGV